MAGVPRGWTFFACVWLSLATVIAHAVLPVGSPIARRSGSPFSITTNEVALGASRRAVPAKVKKLLTASSTDFDAAAGDARKSPIGLAAASAPAYRPPSTAGRHLCPALARPESAPRRGFRARAPPSALLA